LGLPQLFCQQIQRRVGLAQDEMRLVQRLRHACERLDMPLAGDEDAVCGACLPARNRQQSGAQVSQAVTGFGR